MGRSEQRNKDAATAAHLLKMGYPHGRRMSKGLSNIPDPRSVGSSKYQRRIAKGGNK